MKNQKLSKRKNKRIEESKGTNYALKNENADFGSKETILTRNIIPKKKTIFNENAAEIDSKIKETQSKKIKRLSSSDDDIATFCLSIDQLSENSSKEESENENESNDSFFYLDFLLSPSKSTPKNEDSKIEIQNIDNYPKEMKPTYKAQSQINIDECNDYSNDLGNDSKSLLCEKIRKNQFKHSLNKTLNIQHKQVLSSKKTVFPMKRSLLTQKIIAPDEENESVVNYSSLYSKPRNHLKK